MDTSTISPKSYYWGIKTDTITVNMVEIEKNNNQFAIKPRRPVNATMVAIIVQPIVKVSYDILKKLFIQNNLSDQLLIKLFLFAISMLISYFAILISLKLSHNKADKWIPQNSNKYTVTFTTIKKSNGGVYPLVGAIALCEVFQSLIHTSMVKLRLKRLRKYRINDIDSSIKLIREAFC